MMARRRVDTTFGPENSGLEKTRRMIVAVESYSALTKFNVTNSQLVIAFSFEFAIIKRGKAFVCASLIIVNMMYEVAFANMTRLVAVRFVPTHCRNTPVSSIHFATLDVAV